MKTRERGEPKRQEGAVNQTPKERDEAEEKKGR